MRLVFTSYAGSPEYGSPDAWLARIAGYAGILEGLSHDHSVTGIEQIDYEGECHQNGVQYLFLSQRNRINRFPWRLHRRIRSLHPNVVFINGFIFPVQVMLLRLALGAKVKIIILHRSEKLFTGWRKYLQRRADRCVNAYFFSAPEFGIDWINKGIIKDSKKIYEIMPVSSVFEPGDKELAQQKLGLDGTVFLWVGRLDKNKDPLTVVKAFLTFAVCQPSARLYMIYQEGELEESIRELCELHPYAPVVLVGKIVHVGMQDWYNAADFIISSSYYEGGGTAVSEAMSCGCIPLLTDIPSFRKMTGGHIGFLYEPGNADELLSALLKAIQLDKDAEQEKVKANFRDQLSFTAIARKTNQALAALFHTTSQTTTAQIHPLTANRINTGPLVSIIMPTYNRAALIMETIESIIQQSYQSWELLIIDDGSDDETEAIIITIKDKRIQFHKAGRMGINGTIKNIGLQKCRGELIAFIDSDDLWHPGKLQKQVAALEAYPQAGFCLTGGYNFSVKGQPLEYFYSQKEGMICGQLFTSVFQSKIAGFIQALMIRKECLEITGGFKEDSSFSDADFIISLARSYKGIISYEPLLYRRLHGSNHSQSSWEKNYEAGLSLLRDYRSDPLLPQQLVRATFFRAYINFGEKYRVRRQPKKALQKFFHAWTYRPFSIVPLKKTIKLFLSVFNN
jgi:glycosyltransferase involved in cell wall biosynthesis